MIIRYRFVNGDRADVEVPQEMVEAVNELNRLQGNRNQTESRRHILMSVATQEEGMQFSDGFDVQEFVGSHIGVETIRRALEPQQWALLLKLLKGKTVAEIAREEGVYESTICRRLDRIRVKIQKIMK